MKKDHNKLTCRSQTKVPRATVGEQVQRQPVHLTEVDTVTALQEYILYPLQATATRLLKTTVKVEDQGLIMEVDTGASVTIICEATRGRIWLAQPAPPLHLTDVKLRTYGTWHGKLNFYRGILWLFRTERRGFSARVQRNFRAGAAELPRRCRGTSTRVDADLQCGRAQIFRTDGHESYVRIRFENGRNQKANFVRNNTKRSRNTPQGIVRNIIIGIELANCSARNPLIVHAESSKCLRGIRWLSARIYADFPRGRLRKKLSFPCHVPYTGDAIPMVKKLMVKVQYQGRGGISSHCCCLRWTQPVGLRLAGLS